MNDAAIGKINAGQHPANTGEPGNTSATRSTRTAAPSPSIGPTTGPGSSMTGSTPRSCSGPATTAVIACSDANGRGRESVAGFVRASGTWVAQRYALAALRA